MLHEFKTGNELIRSLHEQEFRLHFHQPRHIDHGEEYIAHLLFDIGSLLHRLSEFFGLLCDLIKRIRRAGPVEADIRREGYEVVWKDWDKIFD